jgi:hypothetical protein
MACHFEIQEGLPMCTKTRFFVVVCFLVFVGLGFSAVQAAEQKKTAGQKQTTSQKQVQQVQKWRYTFHNNEWWYWLPTSRWVYWRHNQWNVYNPKSYVAPKSSGVIASTQSESTYSGRSFDDMDVRPFYGHAESDLDRRTLQINSEVGPFYGHPLPGEVLEGWRSSGSERPYYGHAGSNYGD